MYLTLRIDDSPILDTGRLAGRPYLFGLNRSLAPLTCLVKQKSHDHNILWFASSKLTICELLASAAPPGLSCLHRNQRQIAVKGDFPQPSNLYVVQRPLALQPRESPLNSLPLTVQRHISSGMGIPPGVSPRTSTILEYHLAGDSRMADAVGRFCLRSSAWALQIDGRLI